MPIEVGAYGDGTPGGVPYRTAGGTTDGTAYGVAGGTVCEAV